MLIGIDASRANRDFRTGTEWYSYYLIKKLAWLDKENQYILYTDKPLKGGLIDLTSENNDAASADNKVKFDDNGYQAIKSPHNNFKAKVLKWPFNFFWTQGRLSLEMFMYCPDILFIPAHTLPIIHPDNSIATIHDVGFEREDRIYSKEDMGPENRRFRKFVNYCALRFTKGKFGANIKDYLRWSTRYAIKHAAKILTVSEFSKKEMVEIYGQEEEFKNMDLAAKIIVTPNGYNSDRFCKCLDGEKGEAVLKKYNIKKPYIFYNGRLDKKKNTPALIESFSVMISKYGDEKNKLVLVGTPSYGYDEIKYTINEFSLEERVYIPGWIDDVDLPYIFASASAFVFPSLYEGFGMPLLQAMGCEVPVAASRAASIPEVAGDAAILFDPTNIQEMADAMQRIISDEGLRKDLIAKGKERVKNFSWDKCGQLTLEAIMLLKK